MHDEPRPIRELNEDIPEWLCAIVEKLLAKDPDDRFASAVEVEELLGRHLAHLQQPESVPMPARLPAAPVVKHKGPLSPALERKLNSVSLTFLAVGVAAFATAFFSYAAVDQSWYPGATIVCALAVIATLIVFPIVIFAAIRLNWLILLGRTPGNEVMLASKVALIPWSPFLLLTLPVAIRAARIIKRPDVQAALGREDTGKMSDSATSDDGEDDPQPRAPDEGAAQRHWLRRVPIPAWIALLLFLMVYVGAIVEWSGQDAISSRGNGVVFYLLGSGFVLVWGGCSLAARLIHGSGANASSLAPTRRQLATFFTAVIVLTGVFVWQWAELHSETGREQMRAFLFGAGVITLEDRGSGGWCCIASAGSAGFVRRRCVQRGRFCERR